MSGPMQGPLQDIIIDDAEFLFAENVLCAYVDSLYDACSTMETMLLDLRSTAVMNGEVSAGLQDIRNKVQAIRMKLEDVHQDLNGSARSFVEDVDDIDTFVY